MLRVPYTNIFDILPGILQRTLLLISLSLCATISAADERIVDAIKNNDLAAMNSLIVEGVDVNSEFKPGWTPFRMAFLMKNPELLKALIAGGASLDGEWLLNENKHPPAKPGVFNVSRSKRLRGRFAAPVLATTKWRIFLFQ